MVHSHSDEVSIKKLQSLIKGKNIRLYGPSYLGKKNLAYSLFYSDSDPHSLSDQRLCITTQNGHRKIARYIQSRLGKNPSGLNIIDCHTKLQPHHRKPTSYNVVHENIEDLTGIGITFTEWRLQNKDSDSDTFRVIVDSLSSIAMFHDERTIFQFVHTFTSHIAGNNGTGIWISHGDRSVELIRLLEPLFDGTIEFRENNDEVEIKIRGLEGIESNWMLLSTLKPPEAKPLAK